MKRILLLLREENTELENKYYQQAIEAFGGIVVSVTDCDSYEVMLDRLKKVDGILLPGGNEVGPRDFFLIDYAVSYHKKLLGICQGMQSMALWGSQDSLITIHDNNFHYQKVVYAHEVVLRESKLASIICQKKIMVNSYHYQTVNKSFFFKAVGFSCDGLIEAVENNNHDFQIGVQWHPERMIEYDENSRRLFDKFIND